MSFPFSFFGQSSPGDPPPEAHGHSPEETAMNKADPLPWMQPEENQALPSLPPSGPISAGLAALAVQQSTAEPLAPPSRRLLAPGSALAASLAFAAPSPSNLPPPSPPPPLSSPHQQQGHFNAVQSLQSRDLAQLRMDLEREIEQVRQDLFGAAMGVSALKDRLDDLETAVVKNPGSPPSSFTPVEFEHLIRGWLDVHLPPYIQQSVQHTLDHALQHTVATLSSNEFFRMPVHTPGLQAGLIFSQAPQILSSSLT